MSDFYDVDEELTREQVEPLLSPYLTTGFRQERLVVERLEIHGRVSKGTWSVKDPYTSETDPRFHLSSIVALECVSQQIIAHVLRLHRLERKQIEVMLTDVTMYFTQSIKSPEHIPLSISIVGRTVSAPSAGVDRRRTNRTFYKLTYEFGQQACWGVMNICVPL